MSSSQSTSTPVNPPVTTPVTDVLSCPGRHRVNDKSLKWFTPRNKSVTEYTCCEKCFIENIRGTNTEMDYYMSKGLGECNCDYPKDENYYL